MRLDRLLLGRGNDGPFLADSSRPDTPLLMVRLTLNPAHRNGGLTIDPAGFIRKPCSG